MGMFCPYGSGRRFSHGWAALWLLAALAAGGRAQEPHRVPDPQEIGSRANTPRTLRGKLTELRPGEPVKLAQRPADAVVPSQDAGPIRVPGFQDAPEAPPSRLDGLPQLPAGLRDPRQTPEIDREFAQFVERTVDPQNVLDMVVGRPRILVLKQAPTRVYMPDERIATYQVISDTELSVEGRKAGSTVLTLWFPDPANPGKDRILSYLVRVVADPQYNERMEAIYSALERELNATFPDSVVRLSLMGDKLVVRGQAKDVVEADQILQIVREHAPPQRDRRGAEQPVTNTYNITQFPEGGTVTTLGGSSTAPDDGIRFGLTQEAELEEGDVINLLRIAGEQQVMLRVTVAEVSRSALRSIGANVQVGNLGSQAALFSLFPIGTTGGNFFVNRGDFTIALNALRRLDLARTLAEPNLVALNGKPARFFAGGEFPVPSGVASFGAAANGVTFVPFGVQLQFVPYIVDRDKVRMTATAVVSTRDLALATNIGGNAAAGGTSVPGLNSRTFQSTVELREGQTLAVAGLLQADMGNQSSRTPLLGDTPLLGRLFSNDSTQSAERELVILITPELVHPLDPEEECSLPGSDVFEPGDVEFYLKGRLESLRSRDFRASTRTDLDRLMRYHYCDDLFIIGCPGHTYGCRTPPGTARPEKPPRTARPHPLPPSPERRPLPMLTEPSPAAR